MSSLKRDNHILPKLYLKRWGSEGKIFEYRLLVSNEDVPIWTRRPIKSASVQKNIYVHVEDGVEYDDIENWLDQKVETPAAPVIEKVCNDVDANLM